MDFWEVIDEMDFNGVGYEEAGRWLVEDSGLSIEQLKEVSKMARHKHTALYEQLWDVTGVSDDGYDDLRWQIVANGKEFYNNITLEKAQSMVDKNEYKESFGYAFHAVYDAVKEDKQLSKRNKQLEYIESIRQGFGGGFETKLIAAFEHADNGNKRKLAAGFPELFEHLVD